MLRPPESLHALFSREAQPKPCWIEPKILPKKSKIIMGGLSKIGKSFLSLNLIRSLACGTAPFDCDRFSVPEPCRVLYIEQELGEDTLRDRSQLLFADAPVDAVRDRLWYMSRVPSMQLNELEGRTLLHDAIAVVRPNVVVLDPANKFHTHDVNDNSAIAKIVNCLDRLSAEFSDLGLSFIVVHHFGKPARDTRFAPDPLDPYNFLGASAWVNDADNLITCAKVSDLPTAYPSWKLQVRMHTRHGAGFPDMMLTVNEKDDRRVRFKEWVDVG